jgi:hypothetical protein
MKLKVIVRRILARVDERPALMGFGETVAFVTSGVALSTSEQEIIPIERQLWKLRLGSIVLYMRITHVHDLALTVCTLSVEHPLQSPANLSMSIFHSCSPCLIAASRPQENSKPFMLICDENGGLG